MFKEDNGLINRKLYKKGLVRFTESSHYGEQDVYKMFSNSLWDSNLDVFPPWIKIDFSVDMTISAYSLNVASTYHGIEKWSVFDSNGEEIDRHDEYNGFSVNKFNSFEFNKQITTHSLKLIFNKTFSNNVVYLCYFDIYGSFSRNVSKYFLHACITSKFNYMSGLLFVQTLSQSILC